MYDAVAELVDEDVPLDHREVALVSYTTKLQSSCITTEYGPVPFPEVPLDHMAVPVLS